MTKTILLSGLGRYGPQEDVTTNFEKAQAEIQRAHSAGYETTLLELNPNDEAGTLATVTEMLTERHFDGFLIGFGLRAKKEYTPLFEAVVNASREVSPGTKLLFSTAPDAVWEAIVRAFGEGGS